MCDVIDIVHDIKLTTTCNPERAQNALRLILVHCHSTEGSDKNMCVVYTTPRENYMEIFLGRNTKLFSVSFLH